MTTEEVELLFFDTFAHEASEELNLDLVQFPKPVYITQVRIIPLGARVQADFPGGVRLGATNPSQFTIELFVNDLGRPGASTFESLGGLEYNQNGCIHTECSRRIPTDGLVLRGWYTTITLAVYGLLTVNLSATEQQVRGPQDILPSPQCAVPTPQQAPVIVPVVPVQAANNVPIIPEAHATAKSDWKQDNLVPETYPQNTSSLPTAGNSGNTVIIDPNYQNYVQNAGSTSADQQSNQSVNTVIVQGPDYDYYPNEPPPKDPRSYHTPDNGEWDTRDKSRGRSSLDRDRDRVRDDRDGVRRDERDRDRLGRDDNRERDRIRDDRERDNRDRGRDYQKIEHEPHSTDRSRDSDRDRRERRYSRSHSRDRDRVPRDREHDRHDQFRETRDVRDRDRDRERDVRDRDRERERYTAKPRSYRDDRDDRSKKPRTPPPVVVLVNTSSNSPKRPHTPQLAETVKVIPLVENLSNSADVADQCSSNIIDKPKSPVEAVAPNTVKSEDIDDDTQHSIHPIDIEEFEPILSDEEIVDDPEPYPEVDYDFATYTNSDDLIKLFTPGVTPISTHEKAKPFKMVRGHLEVNDTLKTIISFADEFFNETITKYSVSDFTKCNTELKEEFVHLNEKVMHVLEDIENFHFIVDILMLSKHMMMEDCQQSNDIVTVQVTNITDTLIEWLKIALDYEMANAQTQPGYKIRHIKCGVRLAEICASDSNFIDLLWQKNCFLDKLLMKLFNEDFMALSIKLLILKTLDVYLLNENAIKAFMMDGYKNLIELVLNNPSVRIKFALNSILKKLNLFEVLYKIQGIICKRHSEGDFSAEEITYTIKSLIEILNICQSDVFILSQPKRFLPVASQFEINRSETKPIIITFFKMQNFLQCIMVLLTHPNTMNISTIKTSIFEIITELMENKDGLQYLSENTAISNVLVKYLMQIGDEEVPFSLLETDNKSHNLGLKLAYTLQSYYHIESFKDLVRVSYDYDNLLINEHLHGLFCLTFATPGKFACAKVMELPGNTATFLNLINDNPSRHRKSPEIGYMVDLIINCITYNSNVRLLESNSKQFLAMLNNKDLFEAAVSMKLADVAGCFKPLEIPNLFNYEKIGNLVDIINKNLDNITSFPGQVTTALRILEHLGVSPNKSKTPILNENNMNNYSELKYKHVILQLFSLQGVQIISKLLQKITSYFEQPALHTTTFVSSQGILIINTIKPAIKLLKQMLTYVIECRNTNYKDLTTIPVLLQTFSLVHSFPSSCVSYSLAQSTSQEIIETLLVYTQPISTEVHEKDSLNKTLWSLMCGEVIKYVTTAPYTFMSGLLIFSELLPLPLPIQTQEDLNEEEINWAVNLRKLWSAHLHSNSSAIQELISKLCTTTNQALLNLLRRVCVQLSDLAANSAITIARVVLDIVHGAVIKIVDDQVSVPPCNGYSARVLNFLACLVTHSTVKSAVLNLLSSGGSSVKSDDKYPQLVSTFLQILKMAVNNQQHLLAQECICSIIQSFCDAEITLLQSTMSSENYLANALPDKEHITHFISTLVEYLITEQYSVTYTPILRTLLLITEHDYGFYYLRECLLKPTKSLYNSLLAISKAFSKTNAETVNAASTMIDLLRVCCIIEDIEGPLLFQPRTVRLSSTELAGIIGWENEEDKMDEEKKTTEHPIMVIRDHFKALLVDEPNFENIIDSVESLLKYLSSEKSEADKEKDSLKCTESILPPSESLLNQFSSRIIYTTSDSVDDRLTTAYWLSSPADEGDVDIENTTVDLIEIYRQHFPQGLNLVKIVENMCRISPIDGSENIEKEKLNAQKDRPRRPFVTSGRGRGGPSLMIHSLLSGHHHQHHTNASSSTFFTHSRHASSLLSNTSVLLHHHTHPSLNPLSGARPDPFRSRPPNTSRPPSLHVDDFVALETRGAQPTGPTGYNALSREQVLLMQQQQQQQRQVGSGVRGGNHHGSGGGRVQQQGGDGHGSSRGNYRHLSWWGSNVGRGMYH